MALRGGSIWIMVVGSTSVSTLTIATSGRFSLFNFNYLPLFAPAERGGYKTAF